jgi:serine protease Do
MVVMPRFAASTASATLIAAAAALTVCGEGAPLGAQQAGQQVSFAQSERDRLYAELEQDVAAMDRELSISKRVAALVAPSVVHIEATPLATFRMADDIEEAGSGVIVQIASRNYVLTNRHVVRHSDPEHIRLELADGRQLHPARIVSDPDTDVAVLFIDDQDVVPARLGNSDAMEIGDVVMAFGSPFNLRQSVTRGIVSGKGRVNLDLEDGVGRDGRSGSGVNYQNFLQTDAAINPGNSGGPLVNLRGEIIGLNTAIASNSGGNDGIGFAIPINVAAIVMRQLVESGRVEFGFLGVTLDGDFDARTARSFGLPRLTGTRVTSVTPQSPAALAGIQVDDVILRFNGTPIENDRHLISLVKLTEAGRQVELVVLRGGQFLTMQPSIASSGRVLTPTTGSSPSR